MYSNKKNQSRRNFIKSSAIGLGGAIIAPTILKSCVGKASINDQVLIGHIGVGSRGGNELKNYFLPLKESRSVGICDVYNSRQKDWLEKVSDHYTKNKITAPKINGYNDFEEMLLRDDIDAVNITTPDHWHVPAAIKAARAGKHIMLAKPLGLSYPNFKILEKELIENNVKFHYATQQRSMRHMQLGINMIKEGKIGDVERVLVWAPGKNPVSSPICNEVPVPDGFDYNKWTGPAKLNPYCPDRVTNNSSWFQYDYSIGFLGGWGAHPLDVVVWGIKDQVSGSYTCEGNGMFWDEGGMYNNIHTWDLDIRYDSGLELKFISNNVAGENDALGHLDLKEGNGTTFYGSKGWISISRSSVKSNIPELNVKLNDFPKNEDGWLRSEENTFGQMFIDVIKGRSEETNPLDEAIISDTISHMGDIAIRVGRKVTWDPTKGEVVSDKEANKLYTRNMREPYTV